MYVYQYYNILMDSDQYLKIFCSNSNPENTWPCMFILLFPK